MLHLIVILSFYNSNTIFFPGMQNPIFLSKNTNPNTIDFVYSNSLNYRQILSATMLHLAILKKDLNFYKFLQTS